MASLREAITTHLREDTGSGGLVDLLGGEATRIRPKGTLSADSDFPLVGVSMGRYSSSARRLPFAVQQVEIYAYTRTEARNVRDFVTIDRLLDRAVNRLHKLTEADLSVCPDGDFKLDEIVFAGFLSRDMWDFVIRADYRYAMFEVYGIQSGTQKSTN